VSSLVATQTMILDLVRWIEVLDFRMHLSVSPNGRHQLVAYRVVGIFRCYSSNIPSINNQSIKINLKITRNNRDVCQHGLAWPRFRNPKILGPFSVSRNCRAAYLCTYLPKKPTTVNLNLHILRNIEK